MTIDFRPQGYTHQELYDAVNTGPGAEASIGPASRWADVSSTLVDIHRSLATTIEDWSGKGAEAARKAKARLADYGPVASQAANKRRAVVEEQGKYIADVRAAMPIPMPDSKPDNSGPFSFLFNAVDEIVNEIKKAEAKAHVDQLMTDYLNKTNANLSQLTPFPQPPQVVR